MKLLLDEHFSDAIAKQLRAKGHDAVAVTEATELRRLSDAELLRTAASLERVLVTEDAQHFMPIHGEFVNRQEVHYGILITTDRKFPRSKKGIGPSVVALDSFIKDQHADAMKSSVHWL